VVLSVVLDVLDVLDARYIGQPTTSSSVAVKQLTGKMCLGKSDNGTTADGADVV